MQIDSNQKMTPKGLSETFSGDSPASIAEKISKEISIKASQIKAVIELLFKEECTVPFISRYRKERTGSLDEVAIRQIRDRFSYLTELNQTKLRYLKSIRLQADADPKIKVQLKKIEDSMMACDTKQALEDIYLPFKPKRQTRAKIAKEKGLEPLLAFLFGNLDTEDFTSLAQNFIHERQLKEVDSSSALQGCADILSEKLAETASIRQKLRDVYFSTGLIRSAENKKFTQSGEATSSEKTRTNIQKYTNYFDHQEPVAKAAAHRVMAIRRGEKAKILKLSIQVDEQYCKDIIYESIAEGKNPSKLATMWLKQVSEDCFNRLLSPTLQTQVRLELKQKSETEAIKVFAQNLKSLLMLPPIPQKRVMGVDPGIRTGCKIAVVSSNSSFLESAIIYPNPKNPESEASLKSKEELFKLIEKHQVDYIAVGNGTGSREINQLIGAMLKEKNLTKIKKLVVNESGASIYSTDAIARDEFPDLDASIRSAISIARRLQDPLAELVKIDPKSIGVGQYQHDVNANKLSNSLGEVVESCVNQVGVNLNTSSYKLLGYVSGIKSSIAKAIVNHRHKNGSFKSRIDLMDVTGLGPKALEQAAGFLRIPNSTNPLDNSSVHPEAYGVVEKMAKDLNLDLKSIVGNPAACGKIDIQKYVDDQFGVPTLRDIVSELAKPGRDPREEGSHLIFSDDISEIADLKLGMTLMGTVTNVTNFGAFIDIGVHQDGLVHVSEISHQFITDPTSVLPVGKQVKVKVIDIDVDRRRINLSIKKLSPTPAEQPGVGQKQSQLDQHRSANTARRPNNHNQHRSSSEKPRFNASRGKRASAPPKKHSLDDLMAKFSSK